MTAVRWLCGVCGCQFERVAGTTARKSQQQSQGPRSRNPFLNHHINPAAMSETSLSVGARPIGRSKRVFGVQGKGTGRGS